MDLRSLRLGLVLLRLAPISLRKAVRRLRNDLQRLRIVGAPLRIGLQPLRNGGEWQPPGVRSLRKEAESQRLGRRNGPPAAEE